MLLTIIIISRLYNFTDNKKKKLISFNKLTKIRCCYSFYNENIVGKNFFKLLCQVCTYIKYEFFVEPQRENKYFSIAQ